MSLLANSNAIESGGYPIQRSLRFRSSASAYLNRTPASNGSTTTATISFWVKRGTLNSSGTLGIFGAGNTNKDGIQFWNDNIDVYFVGGASYRVTTAAVYRDPSAWMNVIVRLDTTQATSANRVMIYVNGALVTATTGTMVSQNYGFSFGSAQAHSIGRDNYSAYFDGYIADFYYIDGQALTPSSFGYTEPVTGVWQPLKYMGTYGTNGFYLPFTDNTSATTLAYDKSGNGNNWTPNNISTTAGATYDSMLDVPTLTSETAANYCVFNPLWQGRTNAPTNGNLDYPASSVGIGTMDVSLFSSYWEITSAGGTTTASVYSTSAATTVSVTTGLTYGFRFNSSTGALDYTTNGSSFTSLATGLTSGPYFFYVSTAAGTTASFNGGQRPFSYTPPTGFKALNTFNLPDPTIKKPNQYMDATTWTGTGTYPKVITNAAGFQPDLVWSKVRTAAYDHIIYDSVRGTGTTKMLSSNNTNAEGYCPTNANLSSFDATGFTIGSTSSTNVLNDVGGQWVGWQWKKGATPGFDIVTYTGNGANRTISHSLGVAPSMMIVKSRSQGTTGYTGNWAVWHSAIANTEYLLLNTTAAKATGATYWNSTTPTSSVFSLGTAAVVNNNNDDFVNYLFAEIAGFSKFGSYTGNGSADGPFVYCGFRPKYVMVKRTDSTGNWEIQDTSRSPYNQIGDYLLANASDAEVGGSVLAIDSLSNGFKVRTSQANQNASGGTYIFAAFAENPFKYSNAR